MKSVILFCISLFSSCAAELTYISDNIMEENLKLLSTQYAQEVLVDQNCVYLIPRSCQLQRYFGGASEGRLKLVQMPQQTENIPITKEIFEAKETKDIEAKLQTEKSLDLLEGKIAKAFLDDEDGRGFGGSSEVPLDFSIQKSEAKQINNSIADKEDPSKSDDENGVPSCQLLKDGSGYRLENLHGPKLYSPNGWVPILNHTILFN